MSIPLRESGFRRSSPAARGIALLASVLLAGCGSAAPSSLPSSSLPSNAHAATASPPASAAPTAAVASARIDAPIAALDARLPGEGSLVSLAFDASGNLYVAECTWTYAAIQRISPDGLMTAFAGTGTPGYSGDAGPAISAQFYCPRGMAFAADGAMYVGDHVNNRVRRIDTSGVITTVVGGGGPAGLGLGSFKGDGGPANDATLQEPEDVAFDADGNLYVGDRDNNRIRKVDVHGVISTIAGNGNTVFSGDGVLGSSASIQSPFDLVVDAKGDVIFADGGNNRVRMVDRHGIITTIAGTGTDSSTGDGGPATAATIEPQDVAIDAAGNVYITDDASRSIRRIDRHGVISTVAGHGKLAPVDGTLATQALFTQQVTSPKFDPAGNLCFTDLTSIYRIDAKGILTRLAGKR